MKPTLLIPKLIKLSLVLIVCNLVLLVLSYQRDTGRLPGLYIVQSDSMHPAIATGDLIFTIPASTYKPGDVITFWDTDRDITVTHRIVDKAYANETHIYQTKGDANEDLDTNPVMYENILGKTVLRIPYIGYVSAFSRTIPGFILIVIVPALVIIGYELKNISTAVRELRTKKT